MSRSNIATAAGTCRTKCRTSSSLCLITSSARLLCDTGAASTPEAKAADAEILNQILSRQLGVVAAYPQAMVVLDHSTLVLLRKFRAQEGEHADAIVKALRGLGEGAAAEPEAIEAGALKTEADRLRFVYQLESSTIEAELTAIAKLESHPARVMLAATVANQAEHLAILRRLLGARPLAIVPVAFENGAIPAPSPERPNTEGHSSKAAVP